MPGHQTSPVLPRIPLKLAFLVTAAALLVGWILYLPAMSAPFVFDDSYLPFHRTNREEPVAVWMAGVRPVLMFTYWLNRTLWGDGRGSYHAINLVIHVLNTGLIFLVLWRLFQLAKWDLLRVKRASLVGALIFLVHPLQTESVSYVAGRSESLAALFLLLAYLVFLYRRQDAISWVEAAGVLVLFGLGVLAKENAVSLAGILILTDVFWPVKQDENDLHVRPTAPLRSRLSNIGSLLSRDRKGAVGRAFKPVPFSTAGLRKNWKLYALMAPAALAASVVVLRMLASAPSAGFSLREFTWYQYAFTQARAIFAYIRLSLLPVGQSIDHDHAISRTVFEHGAIVWMVLLGGLVYLALRLRRQYPLFCFGIFWFLIALAPTSSVIPIADPLVERRMYLPMAGLILAGFDLARRVRVSPSAGWSIFAVAIMALAVACYARNETWRQPEKLFAEAATQSTHKLRPYLNLADALVRQKRCEPAIPHLERAERLFPNSPDVQIAWGWALECMGRHDEAMERLQAAAVIRPTSIVYEWIGLLHGEMDHSAEAGQALQKAIELDPKSVTAHKAMALWYESVRDLGRAEEEYAKSLALDPNDKEAEFALNKVRQQRQVAP